MFQIMIPIGWEDLQSVRQVWGKIANTKPIPPVVSYGGQK